MERLNQLLNLESLRQGQPGPVLHQEEVLECLKLIELEDFDRGHYQAVRYELVQRLVREVDYTRELSRDLNEPVAEEYHIVHQRQLHLYRRRILLLFQLVLLNFLRRAACRLACLRLHQVGHVLLLSGRFVCQ